MNEKNEECCPDGESCEEPKVEIEKTKEVKYVNPMEIPYVPSSRLTKLIAKKNKRDRMRKNEL
jgi:hypothetical protein